MGRVFVTGVGPVSSIGIGVEAFGPALRGGRSGISRITGFDVEGFPHQNGGEVRDFDVGDHVRRLDPARWGRSSHFAAAAARLAAQDAGLGDAELCTDRAHAVLGTTSGESVVSETLTAQILSGGFDTLDPVLGRLLPAGRLANAVSTELGLAGESITFATACSASNYALGYGYDLISSGEADVVFAGGADSVCRWAHAGFYRLGALTPQACAPFDRDRSGILTGEGGAVLVLESEEHVVRRGGPIRAELLGYGANCDAKHPVAPDASSIADCMRMAHRISGIRAEEIDYICAHGTGTPANDSVESAAIVSVFGNSPPPVSSIKSMLGHTMGAASGFGAIASVLAIQQGFLPPTINWRNADPSIGPIDPVPNQARPAKVRYVQNNGFAFGGNNAIVVLGSAA